MPDSLIPKNRLEDALWKTFLDEPIKKGVWGMISFLATALVFFWLSPSWWSALALGFAIAFFLIFLFFILLFIKNYRNARKENAGINGTSDLQLRESLEAKHKEQIRLRQSEYDVLRDKYDAEVASLVKTQKELDRETRTKEAFEGTIKGKESEIENLRRMVSEKDKTLVINEWLIKRAKCQAENIEEFVYWKGTQFCGNSIEERIYFLIFQLEIYNASVFEILIDEPLEGKILFNGRRLLLQKTIQQPPIVVKPNTPETFLIRQELSDEEVNIINDAVSFYNQQREAFHKEKPKDYQFYSRQWLAGKLIYPPEVELKGLKINVKGSDSFPLVQRKTLTKMSDVRTSIEDFTKFY